MNYIDTVLLLNLQAFGAELLSFCTLLLLLATPLHSPCNVVATELFSIIFIYAAPLVFSIASCFFDPSFLVAPGDLNFFIGFLLFRFGEIRISIFFWFASVEYF